MGRKRGELKETVTIRLTPKARTMVDEMKRQKVRSTWSDKQYTNSLIIEQAIGEYYKISMVNHKFDFKVCGYCGQNRD